MTKEKLTLEAIRKDLMKVTAWKISNKAVWRFSYIIPFTLLAILVGILLRNPWIGILIFSIAAYHIVRYVIEYQEYKAQKRAVTETVERGDISISVEQLSHIAVETIPGVHLRVQSIHTACIHCLRMDFSVERLEYGFRY